MLRKHVEMAGEYVATGESPEVLDVARARIAEVLGLEVRLETHSTGTQFLRIKGITAGLEGYSPAVARAREAAEEYLCPYLEHLGLRWAPVCTRLFAAEAEAVEAALGDPDAAVQAGRHAPLAAWPELAELEGGAPVGGGPVER
jgi:hypothetical protein